MKYRNAKHGPDGIIDCEIKHPVYGWLPYTLNPDDTDMSIDNTVLFSAMETNGDVAAYVEPEGPSVAELLAVERREMEVSRLQGRLALGEAVCEQLDAMAANPETPWAMRQTINDSTTWTRTSQAMSELGYLLNFTDAQMDELFRGAANIKV